MMAPKATTKSNEKEPVMSHEQNLTDACEKHLSKDENQGVIKLLYGCDVKNALQVEAKNWSKEAGQDFEMPAIFAFRAEAECLRSARVTRVGIVQHSTSLPTDRPVDEQIRANHEKVGKMLVRAGEKKVNVVCMQEAWTMPFAFCTRERLPWTEFAESAESGPTSRFLKPLARKYNMVIVSPIIERDETHMETVWNTAVVIDNQGNYMGKSRKNHIPRVGDFNESTYYMESELGHPVFETAFGKIAINICYGRHHPLNWIMYKINGAEIVFNPSATIDCLSETMWPIEARCAAMANCYYTCSINRVGTETFPNAFTSGDRKPAHKDFGHFYGSSYITAPDGRRTFGLSRTEDGLLIADCDLNLCRQASDKFGFQMTSRISMYAKKLTEASRPDYRAQIIRSASSSASASCRDEVVLIDNDDDSEPEAEDAPRAKRARNNI